MKVSKSGVVIRIIVTVLLILTVCFIFGNSQEVGAVSSGRSSQVLELYNHYRFQFMPELTNHLIRKLAHFCEYMLLGFVGMIWLDLFTKHYIKHISWPILFCVLVAISDETLQKFVSGRSSQVTDVWIDTFGSITGVGIGLIVILIIYGIQKFIKQRTFKNNEKT